MLWKCVRMLHAPNRILMLDSNMTKHDYYHNHYRNHLLDITFQIYHKIIILYCSKCNQWSVYILGYGHVFFENYSLLGNINAKFGDWKPINFHQSKSVKKNIKILCIYPIIRISNRYQLNEILQPYTFSPCIYLII